MSVSQKHKNRGKEIKPENCAIRIEDGPEGLHEVTCTRRHLSKDIKAVRAEQAQSPAHNSIKNIRIN